MTGAARVLVLVLVVLGAAWGGYRHGVTTTENAQAARDLEVARLAAADRARKEDIGRAATEKAQADKRQQEESYAQLDRKYKDLRRQVPLVVPAKPTVVARPADSPAADEPTATTQGTVGVAELRLSGAAVWVWNSALAGHADVPPRACGADGGLGAADPACAGATDLTVDDAWDNHVANAKRCARNTARYERLKAYLRQIEAKQ